MQRFHQRPKVIPCALQDLRQTNLQLSCIVDSNTGRLNHHLIDVVFTADRFLGT